MTTMTHLLLALSLLADGGTSTLDRLEAESGELPRCTYGSAQGAYVRTETNEGLSYRPGSPSPTRVELSLSRPGTDTHATLFVAADPGWTLTIDSMHDTRGQLLSMDTRLWLGGPLLEVTDQQGVTLHLDQREVRQLTVSLRDLRKALSSAVLRGPTEVRTTLPNGCKGPDGLLTLCEGTETVRTVPPAQVKAALSRLLEERALTEALYARLRAVSACYPTLRAD